jgi:hypothetical protein
MANNHYVSKGNRRCKSGKRQDTQRVARNSAAIRQLEAEERARRDAAVQRRFDEEGLGTAHSFEEAFK